jgi:hypothetical protein
MAKGAFKFLAKYVHLPKQTQPPNTIFWTATIAAKCTRWLTALVLVWYVIGFTKAWYARLRQLKQGLAGSNPTVCRQPQVGLRRASTRPGYK